jgi:peptidoglycan/xylan/chitin deacetylase (PgdA/CDA1 family)
LYHRVAETSFDPYKLSVSPTTFERHLQLLQRHFRVKSLDTLLEQLPGGKYGDGTVAITFDDGYADNLTNAQPIAARLGIPMTVFVTVQPAIDGELFWWDQLAAFVLHPQASFTSTTISLDDQHTFSLGTEAERRAAHQELHSLLKRMRISERERALESLRSCVAMSGDESDFGRPMSVAELRELAELPGITIGAHTMGHPVLGVLSTADQTHELVESKRRLEGLLGRPVTLTAYPFGQEADVSEDTYRLAMYAGYRAGFSTIPGAVTPTARFHALPRLIVHDWPDDVFLRQVRAFLR